MGHVGRGVIPYSLNAKCSVPGTVLEAGTTARMSHRRPLPQRKTASGQEASNNGIAVITFSQVKSSVACRCGWGDQDQLSGEVTFDREVSHVKKNLGRGTIKCKGPGVGRSSTSL